MLKIIVRSNHDYAQAINGQPNHEQNAIWPSVYFIHLCTTNSSLS